MISELKEKEDELMMRNGVNSIWMEREETKKRLLSHDGVSSVSGLSFSEALTPTLNQ